MPERTEYNGEAIRIVDLLEDDQLQLNGLSFRGV